MAAMTPQAQIIALASLQGITNVVPGRIEGTYTGSYKGLFVEVPDYLGDLNVAHALEASLTDRALIVAYEEHLAVILRQGTGRGICRFDYAQAKASYKAEAYLKTMNLWVETQ